MSRRKSPRRSTMPVCELASADRRSTQNPANMKFLGHFRRRIHHQFLRWSSLSQPPLLQLQEDFACRHSIHPDRNVKLGCHINDAQNPALRKVIHIHRYYFVESAETGIRTLGRRPAGAYRRQTPRPCSAAALRASRVTLASRKSCSNASVLGCPKM